eukprot:SAG11_NODE_513_length_8837_cov_11.832456_2_plen_855_part_00
MSDTDAMFATHLRHMAPDVLARELKTIMDEVTLVKLEKKAEVEELEHHLREAELEVAEARRIKQEIRQFKADQEAVIEEKEEIISTKNASIRGLERDKKQLQRGLADMAKLAEEEKVLMVQERNAFEAEISRTLQGVRDENARLAIEKQEVADELETLKNDKQRVVDSARTAKLGLLKELKEAKITMDQTEQERQDEVDKMSGLAGRVEELGTQLLQYVEENKDLKLRVANSEEAVTRMARQLQVEREERAELQKELDQHRDLEQRRRDQNDQWQTVADKAARLDELEPILAQTEGQLMESRVSNDQLREELEDTKTALRQLQELQTSIIAAANKDREECELKRQEFTEKIREAHDRYIELEELLRMAVQANEDVTRAHDAAMVKASEHIDTLNSENGVLAKKISELEKNEASLITDNKLREIQLNKTAHAKEIKTLEESVAQQKALQADCARREREWLERSKQQETELVDRAKGREEELIGEAKEKVANVIQQAAAREKTLKQETRDEMLALVLDFNEQSKRREDELVEKNRTKLEAAMENEENAKKMLIRDFQASEEVAAKDRKKREDLLVTKMQADTFDLRQEVRILREQLKNSKALAERHPAAGGLGNGDGDGAVAQDVEELAAEVQALTAQLVECKKDIQEALEQGKQYKDLLGREMNLLHKTMQDDNPHKELVKAWKLENKWARLLEKQLTRANRDNGILGSELQYLESKLSETQKSKDMALAKVTASREVFENELQDLEKLMRRKAKQRQKAVKAKELENIDFDSESDAGDADDHIQALEDIHSEGETASEYDTEDDDEHSEGEYSQASTPVSRQTEDEYSEEEYDDEHPAGGSAHSSTGSRRSRSR